MWVWIFLLLCFASRVLGNHPQEDPSPLAPFESEPSSYVGPVNTITGTYQEFSEDIVIPGPEPLIIQRAYCSLGRPKGSLQYGWNFNHGGSFMLDRGEKSYSCLKGPFGSPIIFYSKSNPTHKRKFLKLAESMFDGLTNSGEGRISGRTNKKNMSFYLDDKDKKCLLLLPSGGKRFYTPSEEEKKGDYYLRVEVKPNGNRIVYSYDHESRLKRIETTSGEGDIYAWANFVYPGDFQQNPYLTIKTSDGRTIGYNFKKIQSDKLVRFFLHQVVRPEASTEFYHYEAKGENTKEAVKLKRTGVGRFLKTEYYKEGTHKAGKKWVKISRDDGIFRRVRCQYAPVGTDETPILIRSFDYNLDRHHTDVYDAHNHPTRYHYSEDSVLTCIQSFGKKEEQGLIGPHANETKYKPYRYENFYWGDRDSHLRGNLLCRTISSKGPDSYHKGILACKAYYYDLLGNVLCESLWGNLTGGDPKPVQLDSKSQYPIQNGCHHYDIRYEYSSDAFHLLLKEQHPNGKVIRHTYQEGTDLMASKITLNGDQILFREFYRYDTHGVLIKTIRDDGKAPECNDLTGVTERHITVVTPKATRPCLGLPEIIEEKYLDMHTGRHLLLKKMVNTYDDYGHLLQQHHFDCNGQLAYVLEWRYDKYGHVEWEKDACGNIVERRHDDNDNLILEQSTTSSKTYTYDFSNRLIRAEERDPSGTVAIGYKYDTKGNKTAMIDCHGNETSYEYDDYNRLTKTLLPTVLTERPTESYGYDILGNQTSLVDSRGFITRKEYNIRGQPIHITYPDESQESFEYSLSGKMTKSTDKNGLVTTYEYDVLDRMTTVSQYHAGKLLTKKTSVYNAFHLIKEIDEMGDETHYGYDCAGRLICQICGNQKTTYAYDTMGRQTESCRWVCDTESIKEIKTYDALNRVTKEILQDQNGIEYHRVDYTYQPDGQRSGVTTYLKNGPCTTTTVYNSRKQLLSITDPEGHITRYDYNHQFRNSLGQLVLQTAVTDPAGNITTTTHDACGRIVSIVKYDPMGAVVQKKEMMYDVAGKRIRLIETNIGENSQHITAFTYDSMNRLKSLVQVAGPQEKHTLYSYNASGQKETLIKPNGCQIKYTYDPVGRLSTFQASDGSFSYEYVYNLKGLPLEVKDRVQHASTQRLYNHNSQMIEEKLQNGLTISYHYDKIGRVHLMTLPDKTSIRYEYAGPYLKYVKRYDFNGKMVYQHIYSERDLSGNSIEEKLAFGGSLSHTYDKLGRVLEAKAPQWEENLTYNSLGELVQRRVHDQRGEVLCSYEYDSLEQLTKETGILPHTYTYDSLYNRISIDQDLATTDGFNQILSQGDESYAYDLSGNRVKKGTVTYTYDALDRLTSVIQDNGTTVYTYDAFNRRMSKTFLEKQEKYLYADQNEIGASDGEKIQQLRVLGTGKGAEIGAAVAMELGHEVFIPLHDHNGNVTCLIDTQGQVRETIRYNAFGEEEITDADGNLKTSSLTPWRFSSKRVDAETGWVYFGRRYYDPVTGRWTTPDPLGLEGEPNLYAYVGNNPLTHFDLYGLFDICGILGALFCFIGSHFQFFCYECIPLPLIKDIFTATGHLMQGKALNEFVPSYRETHSHNRSTKGWEDTKKADVYVNGIRTSPEDAWDRCDNYSNKCNGKAMHMAYNAMHGLTADLLEWMGQRLGIPTNSVDKLVVNVRQRIRDVGGVGGGGRIRVWAHSQGGEIVSSLRSRLTREELAMIDVKTYGSANLFKGGGFGSVRHYVSTRDWVALGASPFQYLDALSGNRPDVVFLPAIDNPFFDHSFEGHTYQQQHLKDIATIR